MTEFSLQSSMTLALWLFVEVEILFLPIVQASLRLTSLMAIVGLWGVCVYTRALCRDDASTGREAVLFSQQPVTMAVALRALKFDIGWIRSSEVDNDLDFSPGQAYHEEKANIKCQGSRVFIFISSCICPYGCPIVFC